MSWHLKAGHFFRTPERAFGVEDKLAGYSLKLEHVGRGKKAEGFARVLAVTLAGLGYLSETLLDGIRSTPMSDVRPAGRFGVHCEVIVPVRGLRDRADRTATF